MVELPIFTLPGQIGDSAFLKSDGSKDEEQKILVYEPDVIVNDLDTLEPNDELVITTMTNLIEIEKQLA